MVPLPMFQARLTRVLILVAGILGGCKAAPRRPFAQPSVKPYPVAVPAREVLLYEIGVRSAWRLRGVGRQLFTAMRDWMRAEAIDTAWVLAGHPGAERFYEACGFHPGAEPVAYLELHL